MRSKLVSILRQTASRAEKFNDYNFRVYFVNKYSQKADFIESAQEYNVKPDEIKRAERYVLCTLSRNP